MRDFLRWTPEMDELLREQFDKLSYGEIGELLEVTPEQVRYRARRLGLLVRANSFANNERDNAYMVQVWRGLE